MNEEMMKEFLAHLQRKYGAGPRKGPGGVEPNAMTSALMMRQAAPDLMAALNVSVMDSQGLPPVLAADVSPQNPADPVLVN